MGTFLFPYSWPKKRNIVEMKKTFPSVNFSFWAVYKQVCLLGNTEGHSVYGSCIPSQPCLLVLQEQAVVQEILLLTAIFSGA